MGATLCLVERGQWSNNHATPYMYTSPPYPQFPPPLLFSVSESLWSVRGHHAQDNMAKIKHWAVGLQHVILAMGKHIQVRFEIQDTTGQSGQRRQICSFSMASIPNFSFQLKSCRMSQLIQMVLDVNVQRVQLLR